MSSREMTLTAARAWCKGSAMREGVTTRFGLSSRVSMSSACDRPGKHAASHMAAKRNRMIMVFPWRSPASTIRCGGGAGKNPQTQVALRNAVTANPGPVSGLARGSFAGMDAWPEPAGRLPTPSAVALLRKRSGWSRTDSLTVAGAVPDFNRLPVSPGSPHADEEAVFPGTQSNGPAPFSKLSRRRERGREYSSERTPPVGESGGVLRAELGRGLFAQPQFLSRRNRPLR